MQSFRHVGMFGVTGSRLTLPGAMLKVWIYKRVTTTARCCVFARALQ